jgi:hypothetical protein
MEYGHAFKRNAQLADSDRRRAGGSHRSRQGLDGSRSLIAVRFLVKTTAESWSNEDPISFHECSKDSENGCQCRVVSITYDLQIPFHSANAGSNPAGDARNQ